MKEKILKLRQEGKTYKEIQKELNCSLSTISYYCGKGQKEKLKIRIKKYRKLPKVHLNHILNCKYYNIFVKGHKYNRYREKATFSLKEFKEHIIKYNTCYITGRKINLEKPSSWQLDHVVPFSKGGKTTLENLRPVIKEANAAKSNLSFQEFLKLCKDVLRNNGYKVSCDGVEPPES